MLNSLTGQKEGVFGKPKEQLQDCFFVYLFTVKFHQKDMWMILPSNVIHRKQFFSIVNGFPSNQS